MKQISNRKMLWVIVLFLPIGHIKSQITSLQQAESFYRSEALESQPALQHHPWWVTLGAGPAFVGKTFALNAGMVYSYQFDRSLISARILGVTNNNPTVQKIEASSPIYKMADYGILYGPMWQTAYGIISLGAGIGIVRAAYETSVDSRTNSSISVPIEAQWFWRITPYAGLGVYAYASFNFEQQISGLLVSVQLGAW